MARCLPSSSSAFTDLAPSSSSRPPICSASSFRSEFFNGSSGFELQFNPLSRKNSAPFHVSCVLATTPSISIQSTRTISPQPIVKKPAAPLQQIPGTYGAPLLGNLQDRIDYFWNQGTEEFLASRMAKYNSSVFRVNMPPGPPFFPDSRVIMLLDQKSFQILFDIEKVSKKDVFTGSFMPDTGFSGGFRTLSYLDPIEDQQKHAQLKSFCFEMLRHRGKKWMPELDTAMGEAFEGWEDQMRRENRADVNGVIAEVMFNMLSRSVLGRDPRDSGHNSLGNGGIPALRTWIALQLAPLLSTGTLSMAKEELLLHTFPLPPFFAKKSYNKICKFFKTYGKDLLDMAQEKYGINREEALHNLVFLICFNTHGGLVRLFPSILKNVSAQGIDLQQALAKEVRNAVSPTGGVITMRSLEHMPLLTSTIYEVLRVDPPVPFQYARARKDFTFESHHAQFQVKKGELLAGYQPFATRDPMVFDYPDCFEATRFMGKGKELLKHVVWSNGPETEGPSIANKQCGGKDFVVLMARLFLAHMFLRYDSFELGPPVLQGSTTLYHFRSLQRRRDLNVDF